MCVCGCVRVYVWMGVYVHVCVCVRGNLHINIYIYIYKCINVYRNNLVQNMHLTMPLSPTLSDFHKVIMITIKMDVRRSITDWFHINRLANVLRIEALLVT